jgi:hypothetical protein
MEESRQLKIALEFYHALTLLCRLIIVTVKDQTQSHYGDYNVAKEST